MLSTSTSSIQKRRQTHRRQNSTPVLFEAPTIRPLPAIISHQKHGHRRGMSLDQKPRLLPSPGITNPGQPASQHALQVAQQHRLAQPGSQAQAPYQSIQQPRTPTQIPHGFFDPQIHQAPSDQQIKDLEQHIKSVYGAYGQVVVNILPTPISTPQKPHPIVTENLDLAPMPTSLDEMTGISLDPPSRDGFSFFENPESPHDYASSYYSSDALSPGQSPSLSPQQRSVDSFIDELCGPNPTPHLSFTESTQLLPPSQESMNDMDDFMSPGQGPVSPLSPRPVSMAGLSLEASIEETGISPEEVAAFISSQDPVSHRWTCLFPSCGKTFGRRENIRSHVQTHLGDRQYRCNHCSKCFVRQHDLKRHAKIHTGDKPYKCPCGGGFARQDALTRHRQRGTCEGAFPGAVRKVCKRGRPRKKRTDMEERMDKSRRTREKVKYEESASGGSGNEFPPSPADSFVGYDSTDLKLRQALTQNDELNSDPFSFDTASSPFSSDSPLDTSPFDQSDEPQANAIFRLGLEAFSQTPPASPSPRSYTQSQANDGSSQASPLSQGHVDTASPRDIMPSPQAVISSTFTTPPTSPSCHHEAPSHEMTIKNQFDEKDFNELMTTLATENANVPAMDMGMFSEAGDMLGVSEHGFDSAEAFHANMAWIDSL